MRLSLAFLKAALPQAKFLVKHRSGQEVAQEDVGWVAKDEEISVAFDSRSLNSGELFVPLKGNSVDGHSFLPAVLTKGAAAVLIQDEQALDAVPNEVWKRNLVIVVKDTYQAFLALARAWRKELRLPIVAITGSVGKTTTKEMVRSILQAAGIPAQVSLKNQNTVVGVCTTLLNIKTTDRVAVCEVGISLQGEMAERIEILRPTIAAITNIGHAHAEGLGGVQGIATEKRQIFRYFESHHVGIINGDQPLLTDAYYHHPIAKFGFKTKNQVQARKMMVRLARDGQLSISFILKWYGQRADVTLTGGHQGYVVNALTASTIAYFLNIPFDRVIAGLTSYEGFEGRFQIHAIREGRGRLISDCYNANPESMRAAIEAFGKMQGPGKKVAVIGDMLELGDKEIFWNRQVGRMIAKAGRIDEVILVGPLAAAAQSTVPFRTRVILAPTWQEAVGLLDQAVGKGAFVLVKGSRGVGLKNLVEAFIQ